MGEPIKFTVPALAEPLRDKRVVQTIIIIRNRKGDEWH